MKANELMKSVETIGNGNKTLKTRNSKMTKTIFWLKRVNVLCNIPLIFISIVDRLQRYLSPTTFLLTPGFDYVMNSINETQFALNVLIYP